VAVQLFVAMMALATAKEPLIAGRAAIGVLIHHKVAEPILDADSSRTEELFAATTGTTRDLSLRSGFVHGKILCWGRLSYNTVQGTATGGNGHGRPFFAPRLTILESFPSPFEPRKRSLLSNRQL
jgi:hypothetical protein